MSSPKKVIPIASTTMLVRATRGYLKKPSIPSTVLDILRDTLHLGSLTPLKQVFLSPTKTKTRRGLTPLQAKPLDQCMRTGTLPIDDFRPRDLPMSSSRWQKLAKFMLTSFTVTQLKDYVGQRSGRKADLIEQVLESWGKPQNLEDIPPSIDLLHDSNGSTPLVSSPPRDLWTPSNSTDALLDILRPEEPLKLHKQWRALKKALTHLFTAGQLAEYMGTKQKKRKALMVEQILAKWQVVEPSAAPLLEDFRSRVKVPMDPVQMHLILRNQRIVHHLRLTGVKISFDTKALLILFKGTERQVTTARILLDNALKKADTQHMSTKHLGPIDLAAVAANTDILFQPIDQGVSMTSLNPGQFRRAKRMLLWQLSGYLCARYRRENVIAPLDESKGVTVPYVADDVIDWTQRHHKLTMREAETIAASSTLLETVDRYRKLLSPPNPASAMCDLSMDAVADAKDGLRYSSSQLELMHATNTVGESAPLLAPLDLPVDEIYDQLDCTNSAAGVVTVTFGNVTKYEKVRGKNDSESGASKTAVALTDSGGAVYFNSNVGAACDRVMKLPLFDYPDLLMADVNHLLNSEPGMYRMQLNFFPLPWEENPVDAPPVELWATLTDKMTVDLELVNLVTVEAENTVYVPLSNHRADLKVTYQQAGELLSAPEPEPIPSLEDSIESLLARPVAKILHVASQPGLAQFFAKSKLVFKNQQVDIHPKLDIVLTDGRQVTYQYVLTQLRRLVDFEYDGRLAQYTLIEGGKLGGRRHEVTLVCEPGNCLRTAVSELISTAANFVREL